MQITCSRHEAVREEREISGAERPPRALDQRARERVPSAAAAAAEQSRESGSRSQRLQATITFHITSVMKSIIRISTIFDPRSLSLSITHSLSRPRLPPSLLCSHLAVPRLTHESRSASTHPLSLSLSCPRVRVRSQVRRTKHVLHERPSVHFPRTSKAEQPPLHHTSSPHQLLIIFIWKLDSTSLADAFLTIGLSGWRIDVSPSLAKATRKRRRRMMMSGLTASHLITRRHQRRSLIALIPVSRQPLSPSHARTAQELNCSLETQVCEATETTRLTE